MAQYGISYMGSKSKICNDLIRVFPTADNFYDLFGGGFSITHAMLTKRQHHFQQFHFNEIRPGICELISNAIEGKYNYDVFQPKFVSREEFSSEKDKCAYTKMFWSFGNNGKDYLFSAEIEPYKKSMHNAIVFNEFDDLAKKVLQMDSFKEGYDVNSRRLFLRSKIELYRKTTVPEFLWPFLSETQVIKIKRGKQLERLQQLQQLQQLQWLERLERLQQLQQLQQLQWLERLEFYNLSYELVPIRENSVIYCDIPYRATVGYDKEFNHSRFFNWAANHITPIFISEYQITDPRFTLVHSIKKRSLISSDKTLNMKNENVYANKAAINCLRDQGRLKS